MTDKMTGNKKAIMITLLLVDDQPAVLQALRECFALEPNVEIVGEAGDGEVALELAKQLHPDIMLTDLKMPNMDGIAATEAIREISPDTKVWAIVEPLRMKATSTRRPFFSKSPASRAIHRTAWGPDVAA